ncbi:hypothetical protein K445DRAFT_57083 [Daldinia sp. EC12]|nr:hypothetical protein K445DRAFT_57083 [Daldinia sp. EC12]
MALVDYSSDSESEAGEAVTTKRQKTSHDKTLEDSAALPPLPDAFHDLYASTVRVSTSDDPTLHQGRKRVNPHRVGSWPSHLYTEWHPTPSQRTILSTLLSDLQTALAPLSVDIKSFLTSDLGAPQPLHISLSRPIVLSTADKDDFLEKLISRVKSGGIGPFDLTPRGLEWHRTSESERSFLVLRVGSTASTTGHRHNPELAALLQQCNALVQEHQQPPLYAFSGSGTDGISDDDAFHISIAWSFAPPSPDVKRYTERAFAAGPRAEVLAMRVPVRGVKAKIGNVITPVELPVRGKKGA